MLLGVFPPDCAAALMAADLWDHAECPSWASAMGARCVSACMAVSLQRRSAAWWGAWGIL